MKKILGCLLLLIPVSLLAQKCHYEFDKVDDFTKERLVLTEYIRMFVQGRGKHAAAFMLGVEARKEELFVAACNYNGKNMLSMKVRSTDSRSHFYSKKYMLLLENGDIVNLWKINAGGKRGAAVSFSSSDAGWSSFLVGVDAKGWNSLKSSNVKKIRLPKDEYNNYDIEIEDDDADAIKKGVACIESLNIKNPTFEQQETAQAAPARVEAGSSAAPLTSEPVPTLLTGKKWHSTQTKTVPGKTIELEFTTEYFPNNEYITDAVSTIDGVKHPSTTKGKFSISGNGKYIIFNNDKVGPVTYEIVTLADDIYISKNLSDGKVVVYNKL